MNLMNRWVNSISDFFSFRKTINDGSDDEIGAIFLKYSIEKGGLKSSDDVLDVGSGYGRMAKPLTTYLNPDSQYEGIEIIGRGVRKCKKLISKTFPNFHFQKIDVHNKRYNPRGSVKAAEFTFPFEDESFDFVLLTSVFTHMLPDDLANYLKEIARVLKKGGTCFITYFLLNDESSKLIDSGSSHFNLSFKYESYRIESEEDPEYVVAYDENLIRAQYDKNQLDIKQVYFGSWSGRADFLDFQDIIIAKKN